MKHTITHSLSLELSKLACEKAFEAYADRFQKYKPTADWTTESSAIIGFEAKGMKLGGTVELRQGAIDLEMKVPFIFKPFRNKAMEIVEREIRDWIARAENGELD